MAHGTPRHVAQPGAQRVRGLIFAFIGSFDEVIVTSFIAGKYDTVPKKMFNELILEVNPTITAVATLLIAFTVVALAAVAFTLGRAGKLKQTIV